MQARPLATQAIRLRGLIPEEKKKIAFKHNNNSLLVGEGSPKASRSEKKIEGTIEARKKL